MTQCTFTKHEGKWAIRASKPLEVGEEVELVRRNGDASTEKVGVLLKHWPKGKYPEAWVYAIKNGDEDPVALMDRAMTACTEALSAEADAAGLTEGDLLEATGTESGLEWVAWRLAVLEEAGA